MAGEGRCMYGCIPSNLKKIMAGGVSGQLENPPGYATDAGGKGFNVEMNAKTKTMVISKTI